MSLDAVEGKTLIPLVFSTFKTDGQSWPNARDATASKNCKRFSFRKEE